MTRRVAYYPGCSLKSSAADYDLSLRAIAPSLGLELKEIDDWNCCGATSAHQVNEKAALGLAARVLALAEKEGFDTLLAPCASCWHRLVSARAKLKASEPLRKEIEALIEMPLSLNLKVLNLLQCLHETGLETISGKITNKLGGIKTASYYGCLMLKPPKMALFEDPDAPRFMDECMKALGAQPVAWNFKAECCGAGHSLSRSDLVVKMTGDILQDADLAGAEAFVVACPMCQTNLDLRQRDVNRARQTSYKIPALYLTQWIGLALGLSRKQLGIEGMFVDPGKVLEKIGKVKVAV
jgi:heterodisulfide reductase subunit B2